MVNERPLRLATKSRSCNTLYAGQSFMASQLKTEPVRENIDHDLRVPFLQTSSLCIQSYRLYTLYII